MKHFTFILIVLLGISNTNFSQKNAFGWSDNTFTVGAKKEIEVMPVRYCNTDMNNDSIAKIIVHFMNENPTIRASIIFHSDSRGSIEMNKALTQRRAEQFCKYLKYFGVKGNRLTPIEIGESQALIPTDEIEKLKTKEEKEEAHKKNRRIEIQIAEI